jgi:hypothetical protein
MTGTNCDLFTHKQSRSYLNHLVHSSNFRSRLSSDSLRCHVCARTWAISVNVDGLTSTIPSNVIHEISEREWLDTEAVLQRQNSSRRIAVRWTFQTTEGVVHGGSALRTTGNLGNP